MKHESSDQYADEPVDERDGRYDGYHVDERETHQTNRRYKDTMFRDLFGSPERKAHALELYNALAGTDYDDPEQLELTTLDDVIYLGRRNDVSFIIGDELVLIEHQSTPNPNMPLRGLVYFGRLYSTYVDKQGGSIYGQKLLKLPTPRFVVIYCAPGGEHKGGKLGYDELWLSDAFEGDSRDIEVHCRVVDVGSESAADVLSASPVLTSYADFVERVAQKREIMTRSEAIDETIDEMIAEGGPLSEYLRSKRAEVADMFMTEYDEAAALKCQREEGFEEGLEAGAHALAARLREMGVDEAVIEEASRAAKAELAERASSRS